MRESLVKNLGDLGPKIAVIGGTFDPVHCGHLAMGEKVLQAAAPSAVLFVPAAQNPLKPGGATAANSDRLEMLRLALAPYRHFFVSALELERSGPSYTVDTLRALKQNAPGTELIFVCGADQLSNLHRWREIDEIFSLATIFVLGRDGLGASDIERLTENLSPQHRSALIRNFTPFQEPAAATEIREALAAGDLNTAIAQLPKSISDYITSNQLYQQRSTPRA